MPGIKSGSNYVLFAALYCSCLGFNGLLALPTKEGGNKGISSKKGATKCYKDNNAFPCNSEFKVQHSNLGTDV